MMDSTVMETCVNNVKPLGKPMRGLRHSLESHELRFAVRGPFDWHAILIVAETQGPYTALLKMAECMPQRSFMGRVIELMARNYFDRTIVSHFNQSDQARIAVVFLGLQYGYKNPIRFACAGWPVLTDVECAAIAAIMFDELVGNPGHPIVIEMPSQVVRWYTKTHKCSEEDVLRMFALEILKVLDL